MDQYPWTLAALAALSCLPIFALGADLPPMPALKTFHLEVTLVQAGAPRAAVVAPATDTGRALASRLVAGIAAATGAELPILDGIPEPTDRRDLVLLGRFDDPALQHLYRNHFIYSDTRFPGPGGYEVRTVHDPYGDGRCVLFLGGSDAEGQSRALDVFLSGVKAEKDLVVPHTVTVAGPEVPTGRLTEEQTRRQVEACDSSGLRAAADIICSAGLAYHRYGDPGQAEVFRQGVDHVAELVSQMDRVTDTRGILTLPTVWDMLEECPAFSAADRAKISGYLWEYANKCPNAHMSIEVVATPQGNNWNSRANWAAALYYRRYYGIDVAGLEQWCERFFASQVRSWKPAEDCPGYGSITWYDAMSYVLEKGTYGAYRDSGNLARMADYAMMITNNLGYVSGFGDISALNSGGHVPGLLLIAAWLQGDGRYLWFYDKMPPVATAGDDYFGNHYFVDTIQPTPPNDLLGLKVFELPDWVYEHRARVLGAASTDANAILDTQPVPPYEKCFDKVSFREGFDPADDYLLMGGISHGYHAHPDGNAVICYTSNGKYWLFDNGYFVPDTIEHNTVCVFRDGLFEPVPRLTSLEGSAEFAKVAMAQTHCAGYNGTDWRRNVLWRKGQYFAVLDELRAQEDGDYNLQCVWRTVGDVELRPDRMLVTQGGERFCLINGNHALLKLAEVTPEAVDREALIQTCPATLKAGQSTGVLNLFYSPDAEGYPYDAAGVGDLALVVAGPEGHTLVAAGPFEREDVRSVARLASLSRTEVVALDATELDWNGPLMRADKPVSLHLDRRTGEGELLTREATRVGLLAAPGIPFIAGSQLAKDGLSWVTLQPGRHQVLAAPARAAEPADEQLARWFVEARRAPAQAANASQPVPELETLWTADNPIVETRSIFRAVGTADREVPNLAATGTPMCWEEASKGAGPAAVSDGNLETYSAVTSRAPHVNDVPKDIGVQWPAPVTIGQVWVHHYNAGYRPAEDGHDLQYWDGEKWVSIDDEVRGAETADWVHTFAPVTTTRVRLLVTKFNTMRTAVREFRVFSEPVEQAQIEVVHQRPPERLAVSDLNGDGSDEVAAAVGSCLVLYDGAGNELWQQDLGSSIVDLTAGRLDAPAIVASTSDRKLHRIAADGTVVWSVDSPLDRYFPEIEPAPGVFTVLAVGDINADGAGEVVAGNSNWFAYAFDAEGTKLWGSLNWAHPALSIALGDIHGDAKLAALLGTRYNDANLFRWDGKHVGSLGMGYHSCPCATELSDLDGDGTMEMIGGSRIGGLHAAKLDGTKLWTFDMGAEVRATLAADVNGDGKPEVLAGGRNCYVLCISAEGNVLWTRNMLDAVSSMVVADVNADGRPEVVVGVEDGTVHVLDGTGKELAVARTGGAITRVRVVEARGRRHIVAGSRDGNVYGLGRPVTR